MLVLIFVSCVSCWGDMVAIRRVNAQVEENHKMLESIRSKLMQDNYDYETNSAETPKLVEVERLPTKSITDDGSSTPSELTRRFTIIKNVNSTVSVKPSKPAVAKALDESSTTMSTSAVTINGPAIKEFVSENINIQARANSKEAPFIGYEALFDDIRQLLNQKENKQKESGMPTEFRAQEPSTLTPPDGDGKLTLKNIQDLEWKFQRVKDGGWFRKK